MRMRASIRFLILGLVADDAGGQPGAGILLGYHSIEPGLQIIPRAQYGIRGVEERDGALKLAAVAGQFVSNQGI